MLKRDVHKVIFFHVMQKYPCIFKHSLMNYLKLKCLVCTALIFVIHFRVLNVLHFPLPFCKWQVRRRRMHHITINFTLLAMHATKTG